jgi:hypothetical protein
MPVTGKMTVDLYANPDPFVQGMKAAEDSAKKSGEGILGHLSKINSKQIHHAIGGALKTVGIIGAIETGEQIMLATIKGMSDGTVKGMGDFGMVAAKAVTSVIKGLPVLGTFMEIGEEIGKMVAGVNQLDEAAARSRGQFEEMQKVFATIKESKDIGSNAIESAHKQNTQFGMTDDEIKRQDTLAAMKKKDNETNENYKSIQERSIEELASKTNDYDSVLRRRKSMNKQLEKMQETQAMDRRTVNYKMEKDQAELAAKKLAESIQKQNEENRQRKREKQQERLKQNRKR